MERNEETLLERLARLEKALSDVRQQGIDGIQLAQCIEDDLMRLMNSGLLKCAYATSLYERAQSGAMPVASKAALEFAANEPECQAFLTCWLQEDWEALRQRWPHAPETCYVSKNLIL